MLGAHQIPRDRVEESLTEQLALVDAMVPALKFTKSPTTFYQLDVPDDAVANFLDYDQPLSVQPPHIQEAVTRAFDKIGEGVSSRQ